MVAFSGGNAADTCREWPPAARIENYLAALSKVYRGIRASFVKARFMDWPSDPWSKASYSFPAPGQVTAQGPTLRGGNRAAALRRRVHELRVHGLHGGRARIRRSGGAPDRGAGRRREGRRGVTGVPSRARPSARVALVGVCLT